MTMIIVMFMIVINYDTAGMTVDRDQAELVDQLLLLLDSNPGNNTINQSINQSICFFFEFMPSHTSFLSLFTSPLLSSPLFSSILSSFNLLLILLVFNCFVFFLSLSFRIHFVAGWIKNVFVCMCYHTSCFLSSYSCSCSLRHSILAPWYCMNMYTETHRHR